MIDVQTSYKSDVIKVYDLYTGEGIAMFNKTDISADDIVNYINLVGENNFKKDPFKNS